MTELDLADISTPLAKFLVKHKVASIIFAFAILGAGLLAAVIIPLT